VPNYFLCNWLILKAKNDTTPAGFAGEAADAEEERGKAARCRAN